MFFLSRTRHLVPRPQANQVGVGLGCLVLIIGFQASLMSVAKSNVSGHDSDSIANYAAAITLLSEIVLSVGEDGVLGLQALIGEWRPQTPGRRLTCVPRFKSTERRNVIFEKSARILTHQLYTTKG